MRLSERFSVWPLATAPGALTAAQAMILAESLKSGSSGSTKPARGVRSQPRVSKEMLAELARRNNSLDGSR